MRIHGRRRAAGLIGALCLAVGATGCLYFPAAVRHDQGTPRTTPWWCEGPGGALDLDTCLVLSAQLDLALDAAHAVPTAEDALAAGAVAGTWEDGLGVALRATGPTAGFDPAAPDTVRYTGPAGDAQVAGLEWNVSAGAAPEGFAGDLDDWHEDTPGVWTLRAWIVRPFEHQPDVFAPTHPCLAGPAATVDLAAPCHTSSHPEPFEVLVTNDDGYAAAGIDAVVEALRALPGVEVTVVAPATNQSGSGDQTTPGGAPAFAAQTASGYPATAVQGFPADSVLHALRVQHLTPDLVVSGLNAGQNIGPFVELSGTVGAARTAARNGIPALAASQGFGSPPDWASGVEQVLWWVEAFRLGRAGPPFETVANLNVPTCTAGAIRGRLELPTATDFAGRSPHPSNCLSTVTTFADDVDGFVHGYVTLDDVGA